jgi:hypothetical protein
MKKRIAKRVQRRPWSSKVNKYTISINFMNKKDLKGRGVPERGPIGPREDADAVLKAEAPLALVLEIFSGDEPSNATKINKINLIK